MINTRALDPYLQNNQLNRQSWRLLKYNKQSLTKEGKGTHTYFRSFHSLNLETHIFKNSHLPHKHSWNSVLKLSLLQDSILQQIFWSFQSIGCHTTNLLRWTKLWTWVSEDEQRAETDNELRTFISNLCNSTPNAPNCSFLIQSIGEKENWTNMHEMFTNKVISQIRTTVRTRVFKCQTAG
jgi:hypothetical protein